MERENIYNLPDQSSGKRPAMIPYFQPQYLLRAGDSPGPVGLRGMVIMPAMPERTLYPGRVP
jgi:hypothetical protein